MQPAALLLYFYELVGGAATHPSPPDRSSFLPIRGCSAPAAPRPRLRLGCVKKVGKSKKKKSSFLPPMSETLVCAVCAYVFQTP